MNDKILEWAVKIQSIAQAGLTYGHDSYDRERYEQLREIAAEMVVERADTPVDTVKTCFVMKAVIKHQKSYEGGDFFRAEKFCSYMRRTAHGRSPGGWCDVDQSVASNVIKEVKEETGLDVTADKLIAVQDWRLHNVRNYAYGVIKLFVLCRKTGGSFVENVETTEIGYFGREKLPDNPATEKTTAEQIQMCFDAYYNENWKTQFD